MSRFDKNKAIRLIMEGRDPEAAISASTKASPDLSDIARRIAKSLVQDRLQRFHVGDGGSFGKTPDPSCVARELNGNQNPTREQVLQAFAKCSR